MMTGKYCATIAACTVAMQAAPCAFAAAPLTLVPSSPWNVHYADDSCRLAREFGSGPEKVTLLLDQYAPGSAFDISISGEATTRLAKATGTARVGFGPSLPLERNERLLSGTTGTKQPVLLLGRLDLLNREGEAADAPVLAADIAKIHQLQVTKGSNSLVLQLGPIAAALKAVGTCTADLVKLWGLDPAQQANLASGPVPRKPAQHWLRPADYPGKSLRKGDQAVVYFRLMVDETGMPTECKVQNATQSPAFIDLTCRLLMKRARFEPAVTKDGTAVASYYTNGVNWITSR